MRTVQVAEVRETQPDCRLYIAITKCDQLEETPSVAEQDTGEFDSSNSSNGGDPIRQWQSCSSKADCDAGYV